MPEILLSFILVASCFSCIYLVHAIFFATIKEDAILAAFGASAVLSFGSQTTSYGTKDAFFGAVIGAIVGVSITYLEIPATVGSILSISICIAIMQASQIIYPPGGAISLIPIMANQQLQELGFLFVLSPVCTGICVLLLFSKLKNLINKTSWQVQKQSKS
ncbi:HPP family protein [Aquimarina hainanensis]|uniref:HPP family protein n=1 Tax=Aquimarina hainanensis TaxID=1578017 RepID=A0ABW5NDY4_9FLAO|nr:HPP family protein [Aquimarina sp. TRL1]QKX06426.1 HPP family protein [Aquimarina sp. TRL1]